MQLTLHELKSQEVRLPETSLVLRAFNDDEYDQASLQRHSGIIPPHLQQDEPGPSDAELAARRSKAVAAASAAEARKVAKARQILEQAQQTDVSKADAEAEAQRSAAERRAAEERARQAAAEAEARRVAAAEQAAQREAAERKAVEERARQAAAEAEARRIAAAQEAAQREAAERRAAEERARQAAAEAEARRVAAAEAAETKAAEERARQAAAEAEAQRIAAAQREAAEKEAAEQQAARQAREPAPSNRNIPAPQQSAFTTAAAAKTAARDSIFDLRQRFSRLESAVALAGFVVIAAALGYGWYSWDNDYALVGDADTAYNYGLTGGIMMLVILLYSLRKRVPALQHFGNITLWYYVHFTLGVIAPILIVLHTSFTLRSINATVAFIAMLLVVCSGFLGRYIYTRASQGVTYREKALKSARELVAGDGIFNSRQPALQELDRKISEAGERLLQSPATIREAVLAIFVARPRATMLARSGVLRLRRIMTELEPIEGWSASQRELRTSEQSRRLEEYMHLVGNIALFQGFERLAAGWRLLHVPILYLLALAVAAHVVAVHMY